MKSAEVKPNAIINDAEVLTSRLDTLKKASNPELKKEWRALFGASPPNK